ncbi:MAG TPA: carboxypeptidase-like regulatory domain-containing protein, partial [Puia sp.]
MRILPWIFRSSLRTVALSIVVSTGIAKGEVNHHPAKVEKDVYVSITRSIQSVKETFETVTSQTHLTFTYDEYQVDLSRQVKLKKGQIILRELLSVITAQTGLRFTLNKKLIIVTPSPAVSINNHAVADIPVKGNIRDTAGNPMAGANITIRGTKKTVQSDSSGNFSLDAPSNAVLIITFSGYSQVESPVNGRQNVDIVMNQIPKALNEVVVFGYQTHKRGDVTGAISIIDVSGVSRQPVGFVEQGLQGKAAGVRVTQSSGQPGDGMA